MKSFVVFINCAFVVIIPILIKRLLFFFRVISL
jgi:hypothetical protein